MMKLLRFSLGSMDTNCYFVYDEATKEAMIVDPADWCDRILQKISDRALKVKYIALTHAHFDHMLALEELRDATGAPLCLHRMEAPALADPAVSLMGTFAGIQTPIRPAEKLLEDGDVLRLGEEEITVLHTPGHTVGSVCYMFGDIILTGDTLMRDCIGRYDFPGGDYAVIQRSLKRLASLEEDYRLFPGHGASTTLLREKTGNFYLQ